MRRVPTIMRRELSTYFRTPLAYLVGAVFSGLLVFFAAGAIDRGPDVILPGLIGLSCSLLVFCVPVLTMRLLAEEGSTGAMEVLVTDPVTDWDIVLGKFFASVITILAMLSPVMVFAVIYAVSGKLQPGENDLAGAPWYKIWVWLPGVLELGKFLTGLVGLGLVVALFAAVGLLASALTRNQAVSALIGIVAGLVIWLFHILAPLTENLKVREFIENMSPQGRLGLLIDGRLDTKAVFLFVSTTVLLLYLSVRVVESRKWR